jgi:hypothetical protein
MANHNQKQEDIVKQINEARDPKLVEERAKELSGYILSKLNQVYSTNPIETNAKLQDLLMSGEFMEKLMRIAFGEENFEVLLKAHPTVADSVAYTNDPLFNMTNEIICNSLLFMRVITATKFSDNLLAIKVNIKNQKKFGDMVSSIIRNTSRIWPSEFSGETSSIEFLKRIMLACRPHNQYIRLNGTASASTYTTISHVLLDLELFKHPFGGSSGCPAVELTEICYRALGIALEKMLK